MKIDNSDDSKVPRILYDNKNEKYCYQLDYNTYIFLDRSDFEKYKKFFEIKDNRLLFFKLDGGKLGGRGLLPFKNKFCEIYSNYDEYNKKYGNLDRNLEFKERGEEIKIYENLKNYFRRKCRVYLNKKNFENNIYSEYDDIYHYYYYCLDKEKFNLKLNGYKKNFNDLKKVLPKIKKNLETFNRMYNQCFNKNNKFYFDKSSFNLERCGDATDANSIYDIVSRFIKLRGGLDVDLIYKAKIEDEEEFVEEGVIGAMLKNINIFLIGTKHLISIKKEIKTNFLATISEEQSRELNKELEYYYKKVFELKDKFKDILEKFVDFFEKVMMKPIFLDCSYKAKENLKRRKKEFILCFERFIETERYDTYNMIQEIFNNINEKDSDDVELKKSLEDLKSYLETLRKDLPKRINTYFKFFNLNWENFRTIGLNISSIKKIYNKFRERFYYNDELFIPENKNSLNDMDKKQLHIFISFIAKIIEKMHDLLVEMPEKIISSNNRLNNLKGDMGSLEEFALNKIKSFKEDSKEIKNVLLTSLEKYLSLYKDSIFDDTFMFPEKKYLIDGGLSYYDTFKSEYNGLVDEFYVYPLAKENLVVFLERVIEYIGKDKSLYENLYELCRDLSENVKNKNLESYDNFFELASAKSIEDAKKRNDKENIFYDVEQAKEQRERDKEYKHSELISLETIENKREIYRKLIKDVNECSNGREFLEKVELLQTYVIPAVLEYDRFFVDFEENEKVSSYKKNVYDNFKNMLIKSLENAIKKINEWCEVENKNEPIVKNIADNLDTVAERDILYILDSGEKIRENYYKDFIEKIDDSINKCDELKETKVDEEYKTEIKDLQYRLRNLKDSTKSLFERNCGSDRPVIYQKFFRQEHNRVSDLFKIKNTGDSAIKKIKKDLLLLKGENK